MPKLYKLIPRSIRNRLYSAVAKQVQQVNEMNLKKYEETLPNIELETKHIKDLKILTNKPALLEVLPKNGIAAEIGVSRGDYSEKILSVTQPQKLHLIDAWIHEGYRGRDQFVKDRFKNEIQLGQVSINQGFSTQELEKFDDGYFDWVYIDSDHTYETTAKELEISRRKVKSGGIIAGHDYAKGAWVQGFRYGVVEAVSEFCSKYNWRMIYLTLENHGNHSYALQEIR